MDKYGVTEKGFSIKRLDEILEELHTDLSEGFGFNTRMDPQSFLNVLIVTFGGLISELWEVAQDSYYAKYPSTAEGVSLDNAVQYGGMWFHMVTAQDVSGQSVGVVCHRSLFGVIDRFYIVACHLQFLHQFQPVSFRVPGKEYAGPAVGGYAWL